MIDVIREVLQDINPAALVAVGFVVAVLDRLMFYATFLMVLKLRKDKDDLAAEQFAAAIAAHRQRWWWKRLLKKREAAINSPARDPRPPGSSPPSS